MSRIKASRGRSSRNVRNYRADVMGIMLIVSVVVALGLIGSFFLYQKQNHRTLDKLTLCPKESRDTESITAIIVDMTDQMNIAQKKDFQNQLEILHAGIPRYGRLEIFSVNPTGESLLNPIISLCNPGRGKDIDPLIGNPIQIEKKWKLGFQEPLEKAFSRLISLPKSNASPIMESIQSVALTSFQSAESIDRPHKLIIVSDLLQFTNSVSFYKSLPDPSSFLKSPSFQSVKTSLIGVDVELWMLRREDQSLQNRKLILLWEAIFEDQGARLTRVYNISG